MLDRRGSGAPARVASPPPPAWWREPLRWYLLSRLLIVAVATAAVAVHPGLSGSRLLSAWDARYYVSIVRHGYPSLVPQVGGRAVTSSLAFFPLFPIAAALVGWLFHLPAALATAAASLGFGAVAIVLFSELARQLADEPTARRATLLFCFFPGSAVFSIGYSESLMIALALGCLLALLREQWLLAGVTAALATATRPNAIALVLACAAASAVAIQHRRQWRSLVAPLLAPAGLAGFFSYLRWHTGESGVWFRVQQEGWDQSFDFGMNTAKLLYNFTLDPTGDGHRLVTMVALGFTVLSCAVFLTRRWPAPVTAYTLCIVLLAAGSTIDPLRPRAILTAFPLLVGLAAPARRGQFAGLAGLSTLALGGLVLFPLWASP